MRRTRGLCAARAPRTLVLHVLIAMVCCATCCDARDRFSGDGELKVLAREGGFLSHDGRAGVRDYALALRELKGAGITYEWLKRINGKAGMEFENDVQQRLEEAAMLVQRGAQQVTAGLPRLSQYATTFDLPGLQVEIAELRLVAAACKVVADDYRGRGEFSKSLRLGRALIAAGLHFETADSELVKTISIVFKEHGLRVIRATASESNDQALLRLSETLLRRVDTEFRALRDDGD